MHTQIDDSAKPIDGLTKVSITVWIGILFLVGTYLRVRPDSDMPAADLLIIVQIFTCCLGGFLGLLLIRKHARFAFGAKALLIYLVAALSSVLFTQHRVLVIGYWVLLCGVCLLTIGIVQRLQTARALYSMEKAILLVLTIILIKDTITALFFQASFEVYQDIDRIDRLGVGLTHANKMGFMAAIAFWISFKNSLFKNAFLVWMVRLLFILVIVLSQSRTSLICWIAGAVVLFYYQRDYQPHKYYIIKIATPVFLITAISAGILAFSLELPGTRTVFDALRRGQDVDRILSLTGRTEVWFYAIERVFDSPWSFFFGHGYGVSRMALNQGVGAPLFAVAHTHNSFIEVLFSLGLFGAISFFVIVIYSVLWFTRFSKLSRKFSTQFALRAVCIVSLVFINSITESNFGLKINPTMMIFLFYTLALDRQKYLSPPKSATDVEYAL